MKVFIYTNIFAEYIFDREPRASLVAQENRRCRAFSVTYTNQ